MRAISRSGTAKAVGQACIRQCDRDRTIGVKGSLDAFAGIFVHVEHNAGAFRGLTDAHPTDTGAARWFLGSVSVVGPDLYLNSRRR
eukprot:UN05905